MASFDFTVDTKPMANEIDRVSKNVKNTTAAVVGMKVAVIAAEKIAADKVCDKVNLGFYTLISSQISQKIVKLASEVDSLYMKLCQQRKQLIDQRKRMGRDYDRILQRYTKLFDGLNRNLRQRIYELERPLVQFCVKDMERTNNRPLHLIFTVPTMQNESLAMNERVKVSDFKSRCLKALSIMSEFLNQMKAQAELSERILLRDRIDANEQTYCVPVIVCESNFDNSGTLQTSVTANDDWIKPKETETVRIAVRENDGVCWTDSKPDADVRSEFSKLVDKSNMSAAAKKMAQKLFDANNYQTLKSR